MGIFWSKAHSRKPEKALPKKFHPTQFAISIPFPSSGKGDSTFIIEIEYNVIGLS
jgi:hypothetical protein